MFALRPVLLSLVLALLPAVLSAQDWRGSSPIPLPVDLDALFAATTIGGPGFTGELPSWCPFGVEEERQLSDEALQNFLVRTRLESPPAADVPVPAELARIEGAYRDGFFELHELWALVRRAFGRSAGVELAPSYADWERSEARSVLLDEGLGHVLAPGDAREDVISLPALSELDGLVGRVPPDRRAGLGEGGSVDLLCQLASDAWTSTCGALPPVERLPECAALGIADWAGFKARLVFAAQSGCLWPHEIWATVHLSARRALRMTAPGAVVPVELRDLRHREAWFVSRAREFFFLVGGDGSGYFSVGLPDWDRAAGPDAGAPALGDVLD